MFSQGTGKPKSVLLKIAAKDCPACTNFDPRWPAIKDKISRNCNVEIKEINQNQKFSPIKANEGPLDLNNYATKWYPCFILVSGASWKAAQSNPHAKLDCVVYNSKRVNGNLVMENDRAGFSDIELIPWINGLTGTPPINHPPNQSNPSESGFCQVNQKYKPVKF